MFCWKWQLCAVGCNMFCWWQPCSAWGNCVLLMATMFCWWQPCSAVNRAVFSFCTVVDNKVVPLSLTANFSSYFWRRKTIVFFYFPLCVSEEKLTLSPGAERKKMYFAFVCRGKIYILPLVCRAKFMFSLLKE